MPTSLRMLWEADLGESPSQAVCDRGLVVVSVPERHLVIGLDGHTGRERWAFRAGARVDTPPSIWNGRALFGSRDGWLYCVDAADGSLAWKFRAAPAERMIPVDGQMESLWPVFGSTMVLGDTVYVVAGRHSGADGGLYGYALDAATGKLHATRRWHVGPKDMLSQEGWPQSMLRVVFTTTNDLLVHHGGVVYLNRRLNFSPDTLEYIRKRDS